MYLHHQYLKYQQYRFLKYLRYLLYLLILVCPRYRLCLLLLGYLMCLKNHYLKYRMNH